MRGRGHRGTPEGGTAALCRFFALCALLLLPINGLLLKESASNRERISSLELKIGAARARNAAVARETAALARELAAASCPLEMSVPPSLEASLQPQPRRGPHRPTT